MKTSQKILIAVLLFFLVDIAAAYILYTKAWTKFGGQHTNPTSPSTNNQAATPATPIKAYSNPDMHLSFNYPKNLEITQVNPSLISLKNPSSTSTDSSLFVFETTIPSNVKSIDIPFVIKGKIKNQVAIPVPNFTAKQITYTDGLNLITLRKDQQFIMVRIPKDSKSVEEAITDFVGTVKTME